jgi:glycosyltransferase involved in cell wall biosynthesis
VLNLPSDLKAGGIAAKLAGVERIIYRRGSAKPIKNTPFNRYLFRGIIDCVIANSQATRNTILKNNPDLIQESKIHVIYNGLDLGRYDALKTDPPRFTRESEIVLGTAGRLAPQKNQKFLIDVARILKQRHIDFKLLIAGEGHLHDTLKRYAMDSGVEGEIVFVGFVQNIKDLMESIDIFVLSSAWEGFGYVIVEAMASRKPVVSLNNSNEHEIVENGETGFLIEGNSAEKFADKIGFFIDHKSQIPIFGENGRKRVAEHFTIQKALIALERLL